MSLEDIICSLHKVYIIELILLLHQTFVPQKHRNKQFNRNKASNQIKRNK